MIKKLFELIINYTTLALQTNNLFW